MFDDTVLCIQWRVCREMSDVSFWALEPDWPTVLELYQQQSTLQNFDHNPDLHEDL